MFKLFKYKKKNFIKNVTLILFLFIATNFFLNSYTIFKNSYHERMVRNHGYCDKQGYGFIKKYSKKYNFSSNVKIIQSNQHPYSGWIINQFFNPSEYKYIILINSKTLPINEKILEQEFNCFILEND